MKKIFGLLLIIIGVVSCQDYTEIKNEELKSAFIINSSPTFEGYFHIYSLFCTGSLFMY
jgi:hypothetical protein